MFKQDATDALKIYFIGHALHLEWSKIFLG